MTRTLLVSLLFLSLGACGGGDSSGKSTTKMDSVEVQPGSISDSMIILDDAASDGTAVDNSIPDDGTKKDAAKADETAADEEAADESGTGDNPDAVDLPAAKAAVAPDSTAKKGE